MGRESESYKDQVPDIPLRILNDATKRDADAFLRFYVQLKEVAWRTLNAGSPSETLTIDALSTEAIVMVAGLEGPKVSSLAEVLWLASRAMRDILLERARSRRRKRGRTTATDLFLDLRQLGIGDERLSFGRIDRLLARLSEERPECGLVAQLVCLAGLGVGDIGTLLGISESETCERWEFARNWLVKGITSNDVADADTSKSLAQESDLCEPSDRKRKRHGFAVGRHRSDKSKELKWSSAIRDVLSELPVNYEESHRLLSAFRSVVLDEMAATLQPRLTKHLSQIPQETYVQKQAVASWVNHELRSLGLAIRCPKTGKPAILVADLRGDDDSGSRFRLEIRADDGRRTRTYSSKELPALDLMADAVREEPFAKSAVRTAIRTRPQR